MFAASLFDRRSRRSRHSKPSPIKTPRTSRRSILAASVAALLLPVFGGISARAADYTWNLGTTGNWDTITANWTGAGTTWVNGATNVAIFGGTSVLVTANQPIAANSLVFNTSGYTISTSNASLITLAGTNPSIVTNFSAASSVSFVVGFTGTNGLIKSGTGRAVLNTASNYTGATQIQQGVLQIATGDNRLPIGTDLSISSGATFVIGAGRSQEVATLSGAGTLTGNGATLATFTVNGNAGGTTFTGSLLNGGSGGLKIVKNGTGTQTFGGTSSNYSQGTTINGGTLVAASNNGFGAGAVTVASGGTWGLTSGITQSNTGSIAGAGASGRKGAITNISGNNTLSGALTLTGNATLGTAAGSLALNGGIGLGTFTATFDAAAGSPITVGSAIAGTGGLVKNGAGTLTLSGTNTYGGTTTVNAGTLLVNGSSTSATTNVGNGGTLGGTGTITGAVNVFNGGTLQAAQSNNLAMSTLFLDGGSHLSLTLGAPNTGVAAITVGTTLDLAGVLDITDGGGFGYGTYRLISYGGSLTDSGLTIGSVPVGFNPGSMSIDTGTGGQVNLIVTAAVTEQYWDGPNTSPSGVPGGSGGSGTWNTSNTNWTNAAGNVNGPWAAQDAVFGGTAGTVTVGAPVAANNVLMVTNNYFFTSASSANGIEFSSWRGGLTTRFGGNLQLFANAPNAIVDGTMSLQDNAVLTMLVNQGLTGGSIQLQGEAKVTQEDVEGIAGGNFTFSAAQGGTGGILELNGGDAVVNSLASAGGAGVVRNGGASDVTLKVNQSTDTTFSGLITNGSGGGIIYFNKQGAGTLTLTGTMNTTGTITVDGGTLEVGTGGTVNIGTAGVAVGSAGTGTFKVTGGGKMTSRDVDVGVGAVGHIVISGSGSQWDGNFVSVGRITQGDLQILDGGVMNASRTYIGSVSTGSVTVSGAGSLLTSGAGVLVAFDTGGVGTLTVEDGGRVTTNQVEIGNGGGTGGIQLNGTAGSRGVLETAAIVRQGGTGSIDADGGVLKATGNTTDFLQNFNSGDITLTGGGLFLDTSTFNVAITSIMDGAGGLTKQGVGSLTLTGANIYTGDTTVEAGVLRIGNGGATGSIAGNVNLSGASSTMLFSRNNAYTFAGDITGIGGVSQAGTGTTTLTGNHTYTGATTVVIGTLRVDGTLGNTAVTVVGGATLAGSGSIAGSVSVQGGGILAAGSGGVGTLTVGGLTLNDTSALNYELATAGVVGGGVNDLVVVNGNLVLDGTLNLSTLGGFGAGTYRLFNYTGALTDNILVFGAVPTGYDLTVVTTTANQVNLVVAAATAQFWDGANTAANATVDGGTGTWDNSTTNWTNSGGNVNGAWTGTLGAIFAGTAGTVTIANGVTISAPFLRFDTTGYTLAATGTGALGLTSTTTVTTGTGVAATISAPISGLGSLTKDGAGTLTLSGANTYQGGTNLNAGTLIAGSDTALGTGTLTMAAGTTLAASASPRTLANAIKVQGNVGFQGAAGLGTEFKLNGAVDLDGAARTLAFAPGTLASYTFSGVISNDNGGGLTLQRQGASGAPFVYFSGTTTNTYTGKTTVDTGVTLTLDKTGGATAIAGDLEINSSAKVIATAASLQPAAVNQIADTSRVQVNTGGTLQIGGTTPTQETIGSLYGSGAVALGSTNYSGSLTVGSGAFSGVISGGNTLSKLIKTGTGTLTLSGTNTFKGGSTVQGGILSISAAANLGTGGVTLEGGALLSTATFSTGKFIGLSTGGGTLLASTGQTLTLTGQIVESSGSQALTFGSTTNAGKIIYSGTATYTGATTVAGGTLLVNSSLANSAVTVASGATLGGTGTLGAVTVNNGGILAPGASAGTLTMGSLGLSSGSILNYELGTPNVAGSGVNDLTVVSGLLTLDGTMNITDIGSFGAGTYTLFQYGTLTNSGLEFGLTPGAFDFVIDTTSQANKVLLVVTAAEGQYWNGSTTTANGTVNGGSGTWNNALTNWTNGTGNTSSVWTGTSPGIFSGAAGGTVDVTAAVNVKEIRFLTDGYTLNGAGSLAISGSTLTVLTDPSVTATIDTKITGTGGLTKTGTGTLVLGGANTFEGDINHNAGTLLVNNDSALGSGGTLILAGGTTFGTPDAANITIDNDVTVSGDVTLTATGGSLTLAGTVDLGASTRTLTLVDDSTVVLDGAVTGTGGLKLLASNATYQPVLEMTGSASNTYTGLTEVGADAALYIHKDPGAVAINGDLQIDAKGMVIVDDHGSATMQIAATTKATVNGELLFGGFTSDFAQTLAELTGSGYVTNGDPGVGTYALSLTVNKGDFSGVIREDAGAGVVKLIKDSSDVLILSGANTFTGGTTISNGTLLANNTSGSATGTGAVNIVKGTLGGNGTISGAVTVNSGASIAPGSVATGISTAKLTIGSLTLNSGSTLDFQLGADDASSDLLVINGALTKGTAGTYAVAISDAGGIGTQDRYTLATFTSTDFVSTDFTLSLLPAGVTAALVVDEDSLDLLLRITMGGKIIQNSAPVGTPTFADFIVQGQVTTGKDNEDNTINSLTFTPGSSLLIHNTLYITTGPVNLVGGSSLELDGTLSASQLNVLFGGWLHGHGGIDGNLVNSGLVSPGNSPGTIHVTGDYTQTSSGTLRIEIAGRKSGQYDLLAVDGKAKLDGTLELVRLDKFKLKRGDKVTFLTAGFGIEGHFAQVDNGFVSDTILEPTVVYGDHEVSLEMIRGSFGQYAEYAGLTPNQRAVAHALDSVSADKPNDKALTYLDTRKLGKLPSDFDKIAPEELSSIFTISTALANVQGTNLQRRADDIRHGSSGFSASGLAMQGNEPSYSGGLFGLGGGVAGPTGNESKMTKEVVSVDEQKWGAFVTGTGEWIDVDGDGNARGYDINSGGFTLGLDYKVSSNFAIGLAAGYTGTTSDLTDDGRVWVNGGKLGLYATYFTGGFYVDAAVTGGYNSFDTKRSALQGAARGSTDGGELNVLVGTGYDWKVGALTLGPTATFQYTLAGMDGFTEHGSLAPLEIESREAESVRTTFGFKASYDWKVGGVVIRPELRAAWQHEYGDKSYDLSASFANGAGDSFLVNGPEFGRDSLLLGAGFAVQCNDRTSIYAYYDGELGRENYERHSVSAGLRFSF